MSNIPEVITEDRLNIHRIIEYMLENADENGIYPTGRTYDELEKLVQTARIEAVGWTWAEICTYLDAGEDPRKCDRGILIDRAPKELNPKII